MAQPFEYSGNFKMSQSILESIMNEWLFFSVLPAEPHKCQTLDTIDLPPSGGYIGKQTLADSGMYINDCIWSIQVKTGQRISLTLFGFLYGQSGRQDFLGGYACSLFNYSLCLHSCNGGLV